MQPSSFFAKSATRLTVLAFIAVAGIYGAVQLGRQARVAGESSRAAVTGPKANRRAAELESIRVSPADVPKESRGVTLPAPVSAGVNPGLVVFEPISSSAETAAFGAGCSRWLTCAVGGLPQFGRQPSYVSPQRIADEWNRKDLRLTRADAVKAGSLMGCTHAAAGKLEALSGHFTLTYTVLDTLTGKPIGSPVSASGTLAKIAAALPQLGKRLANLLAVHVTKFPLAAPTANDLTVFGRFPWQARTRMPYQQVLLMEGVAKRIPAAALSAMDAVRWQDPDRLLDIAKSAVSAAPGNVLVLAEAIRQVGLSVPDAHARVLSLLKQYPNNYLLVRAEVRVRSNTTYEDFVTTTRRAATLCPNNPDAWMVYSQALQNAAGNVRKAKVYVDLTKAEESYVSRMYPEAVAAAIRAVRIDPQYGRSWLEVARAAQFNGQDRVADDAYWKAMHLDREDPALYSWGLQMYQDKWQGGTGKLDKVARLASQEIFQAPYNARWAGDLLRGMQHDAEARIQYDRALAMYDDLAREHPSEAWPRVERAGTLMSMGRSADAAAEYRKVTALYPDCEAAHIQLGLFYMDRLAFPDGEHEFREAVRICPDDGVAHGKLGYALILRKQWKEGETEIRKGLQQEPEWSRGIACLGWALQMQHRLDEAATEYYKALRLEPTSGETWDRLTRTLNEGGKAKEAVRVGEHGMIYNREYPYAFASLAEAYLGVDRYEESASMYSRYFEKMPNDAGAHMLNARALFAMHSDKEAITECNTCIRLLPKSPAAGIARDLLKQHGATGA